MATASAAAWLLLVTAGCRVAVDAVGGPPPVDDGIRTDIHARGPRPRLSLPSLPSKEDPQLPLETLKAIDKLWDLPFFQDDDDLKSVQNVVTVTMDDVDKADSVMHPPLEYSVPDTFRQPDDAFFDSVADTQPSASSAEAADEAEEASDSNTRRLADWLPEGVQKYLPRVPTLSSIFPSYIPGVNLQAEVHRKPIRLPAIPSPADLKVYVNNLLQKALDNLHRKQQQLAELIKCSCPRPARCDGILEEFLDGIKPNKKPSSPSAANIATSAGAGAGAGANGDTASPQLSFYAGLTKPGGEEGPGLGFYVDQSGPHFSHHSPQHQASAQASATSGPSSPTAQPAQPQGPGGSKPSTPSRPSGSAAQSQASATAAAQSQASRPSSSSASAQSTSSAQSSNASRPSRPSGQASASSHSSASASSHSTASASSHSSASASSHSSASASSHSSASASSHSSASASPHSGSGPNASAAAHSSASASAHRHEPHSAVAVSVPPAVPPVPTPTEYTATYGDATPALPLPTFAAPPTAGRAPAPPPPPLASEYAPSSIAFGPPDDYPYSSSSEGRTTTTIPDPEEPSEPLYPSQPDPETVTSPLSST